MTAADGGPGPVSFEDVERLLRSRFGDRLDGLAVLAAGEWSQAFACQLDRRPVVVRVGRYGEDFAKDRLIGDLARGRLPVPSVLALGAAPWGHWVIAERAFGTMLDDLGDAAMRAALPALVSALAMAQDVAVPTRQGFGLWTPDGKAPFPSWRSFLVSVREERPRTAGWHTALASRPAVARAFDEAAAVLERMAADLPEIAGIVHGDLLNRNVLTDGGELRAILDWGNAVWGDPLYDHAWLVFWWPWYEGWRGIDVRRALARARLSASLDGTDAARRIDAYTLHIGLDAMGYNAFRRRWRELERSARRTRAIARRLSGTAPA